MPTYNNGAPTIKPDSDWREGKTFGVNLQRPQALTKSEQRELLREAFANTAKMKPVKKDGGR